MSEESSPLIVKKSIGSQVQSRFRSRAWINIYIFLFFSTIL